MAQKIGDLLTADGVRLADAELPLWWAGVGCCEPAMVDRLNVRRDNNGFLVVYADHPGGTSSLGTTLYQHKHNAYLALADRAQAEKEKYVRMSEESKKANDAKNTTPQE